MNSKRSVDNEHKKAILDAIRDVFCAASIPIRKMLLFGSRARGTAGKESDWDVLVIIDRTLSFNEKWDLIDGVHARISSRHVLCDMVIKSESELEQQRDDPGRIAHYAVKDAVTI